MRGGISFWSVGDDSFSPRFYSDSPASSSTHNFRFCPPAQPAQHQRTMSVDTPRPAISNASLRDGFADVNTVGSFRVLLGHPHRFLDRVASLEVLCGDGLHLPGWKVAMMRIRPLAVTC